jgi:hypothetical protein
MLEGAVLAVATLSRGRLLSRLLAALRSRNEQLGLLRAQWEAAVRP